MDRTEALNTAKEINNKLEKFILITPISLEVTASYKLLEAQIWINKFAEGFNKPLEDKPGEELPKIEEVAEVETIHNNTGKITYKINYLKNIAERLGRYATRLRDPFGYHCLTTAIDKIIEAVGLLERVKT